MDRLWLTSARAMALVCCVVAASGAICGAARAAEAAFPYGRELMLDVPPMKGSKRVPMLEVDEKGLADIDLWCGSVKGQMVIAGDTITILTGNKSEGSCPPERAQADDDMLAALNQVTNWKREGEILTLIGARSMRFRLQTN
jgi:heat shock protein HslJ